MDRIRSTVNGLIKSERYSRFTLQPTENGERHAEVSLSDDATEMEAEAGGSPTFRPAPLHQSRRTLGYLVLGSLMVFIVGFLLGFVSHQTPQVEKENCAANPQQQQQTAQTPTPQPPKNDESRAPDAQMDWSDVTQLFTKQLDNKNFEETLKTYDVPSRLAGSTEDMNMADKIYKTFSELEMKPWIDIHNVQLQTTDSQNGNRVKFGSEEFKPAGYLAYSARGKVQGKLVYGNYGRKEDLTAVENKKVVLNESVLLLRAGKISFAEKVEIAASKGVAAVLIYADSQDYDYRAETELYGHVHLGTGDPYTPGFPSFTHTQFPPIQSSGLPDIPAQTITLNNASVLLRTIGGPDADPGFRGKLDSKLGGVVDVTVEVNNVLVNTDIHNVFGVVKGFTEPDHYVVLGAQRDAWGRGYAKAAVGTSILMELAKAFSAMVKDGFRPRRSVVFASWSAGEFGSVGATEWLEAHMTSPGKNVFTYISLDGLVMGRGGFIASASPLLYSLLESTMKEVKSPLGSGTLYDMVGTKWETSVMRPMTIEDPAYPFLAFSGIPSISFHFISENKENYPYYGTQLDNMDHLKYQTSVPVGEAAVVAAQFAGRMALRLVHDHLLRFDVSRYNTLLFKSVSRVYQRVKTLTESGKLSNVSSQWITRARGSFKRAANGIQNTIINTDLEDKEACRLLNNRLMAIERALLSPYVSPVETPFRHLLFGRGNHTLDSIAATNDMPDLRTQLALATWNLQGCANGMAANIWEIDNEM